MISLSQIKNDNFKVCNTCNYFGAFTKFITVISGGFRIFQSWGAGAPTYYFDHFFPENFMKLKKKLDREGADP